MPLPAWCGLVRTPKRSHSSALISGLLCWPYPQNQSQIWLRRRWRLTESSRRRTPPPSTNIAPPPKIRKRFLLMPLNSTEVVYPWPSRPARPGSGTAPPASIGYFCRSGSISGRTARSSSATRRLPAKMARYESHGVGYMHPRMPGSLSPTLGRSRSMRHRATTTSENDLAARRPATERPLRKRQRE
jgi:hypothetical protein